MLNFLEKRHHLYYNSNVISGTFVEDKLVGKATVYKYGNYNVEGEFDGFRNAKNVYYKIFGAETLYGKIVDGQFIELTKK